MMLYKNDDSFYHPEEMNPLIVTSKINRTHCFLNINNDDISQYDEISLERNENDANNELIGI